MKNEGAIKKAYSRENRPFVAPKEAQYFGAGIYKFTNKENGIIYIGQAQDIYKRYCVHSKLRGDTYFSRALKRYGIDNFDFEILEKIEDFSLLDEREQYYMDFYQSYEPDKGYNIARFASSPTRGRKREKDEMVNSLAALKKFIQEHGHPWLGRNHTEITKQKLSQARKGKPVSLQTLAAKIAAKRKPIAQINIETGDIVQVWTHCGEVVMSLGLHGVPLGYACRGGRYSQKRNEWICKDGIYRGFKWKYITKEEYENFTPLDTADYTLKELQSGRKKMDYKKSKARKKVAQIDLQTGETLQMWDNCTQAALALGLKQGRIAVACRGYYVTKYGRYPKISHGGFKWQYVVD